MRTLLTLSLVALLTTLSWGETRDPSTLPADDPGRWQSFWNQLPRSSLDRARLYPESLAGGGAVIETTYALLETWDAPATDGTWEGYENDGTQGGDEPTIAQNGTTPRFGSNTTMISWDPNGAGQDGQYVEFEPASSGDWSQLRWMYFLRFWLRSNGTTGATELDFAFYDGSGNLIRSFDVDAIGTADVWQVHEFDLRIAALRGNLYKVAKVRITHGGSSAQDVMRIQHLDAYQMSYGNGPVTGTVVRMGADAAMSRGAFASLIPGQDSRVTATTSGDTLAYGIVVEGGSAAGLLTNAQMVAPTAAGDDVYLLIAGPAYLRATATAVAGDAAVPASATTASATQTAPGQAFGAWAEAATAGADAAATLMLGGSALGGGGALFADSITGTDSSLGIAAQAGSGGGNGGSILVVAGAGDTNGNGGLMSIAGGAAAGTGTGGNVQVYSGIGSGGGSSAAGNVDIDTGAVSGGDTAGTILIGSANAGDVQIADTGVLTDIQGTLSVDEAATFDATVAADDLDAATATALLLGKATATSVEIADTGVLTDIQGTLSVDEAATFDSTLTMSSYTFRVPLHTNVIYDEDGTAISGPDATNLGVSAGAPGTATSTIIGTITNNGGTASANESASFFIPIPPQRGSLTSNLTLTFEAAMTLAVRATSGSIDCEVYLADDEGEQGSDICTTPAITALNDDTTFDAHAFTITGTTVQAGDVLHVLVTLASDDTGGGSNGQPVIGKITLGW